MAKMQRIQVNGVRFGYKAGISAVGVKVYKNEAGLKMSFILSRPDDESAIRALVRSGD